MIWNSTWLMTVIDLLIIFAALTLLRVYLRTIHQAKRLGFQSSMIPMLVGILVIALFYLVDLYSMLVMPALIGMKASMRFMEDLHLNWNWLVVLTAVFSMTLGLRRLFQWVIPNTDRLIGELSEAKASLEQTNRTLESRITDRTYLLEQTNVQLEAKIYELAQSNRALAESEDRFGFLYHQTPSIFMTFNREAKITSVNEFGLSVLGYNEAQIVGGNVELLYPEEDASLERSFIENCYDNPGSLFEIEVRMRLASGKVIWVRQSGRCVRALENSRLTLVCCEDITDARQLSERLSYKASHDELTGLCNRRELECRIGQLLCADTNDQMEHALLFMDLDQFKVVNDTCGHAAGDELLRHLSAVLRERCRSSDTLARIGGDEFALLLESCEMKRAVVIAEQIREAVEVFRFAWGGHSFRIGVSIGVVPFDQANTSIEEVLSAADAACYEAKDRGRNRVYASYRGSEEVASRQKEMSWFFRIQKAIDQNRFRLYAQSIIPLRGESCGIHYEILLRMEDDRGELIYPLAFLPAAERYSVADCIDRWVIERVLRLLSENPGHCQKLKFCSINLSAQSVCSKATLQLIIDLIEELSIDAHKLCFEITETAAIHNLTEARAFIGKLRGIGCKFALDDFGSGLSSFGYLKNLTVDYLKIDGSFVKGIVNDEIDFEMVKSINQIGQVMQKKTIAEYVEDGKIAEKLKSIGVDYGQGYGLSRPLLLEEMLADADTTRDPPSSSSVLATGLSTASGSIRHAPAEG